MMDAHKRTLSNSKGPAVLAGTVFFCTILLWAHDSVQNYPDAMINFRLQRTVTQRTIIPDRKPPQIQQKPESYLQEEVKDFPVKDKLVHVDSPNFAKPRFVIGSASSANHECSLANLLASLRKFHSDWTVVVYDLDSSGNTNLKLNTEILMKVAPSQTLFRQFRYDKYPSFFNISVAAGEYAWKPVIIKELVDEFGSVLWMDAGNGLTKRNNLTQVLDVIRTTGFYSTKTKGDIGSFTHPATLRFLNQDNNGTLVEERNCNGAVIGFSREGLNQVAYKKLLVPWVDCAMERDCIAPNGSDRSNHRQDQAVLSVLTHVSGFSCAHDKCWESPCDGITLHNDARGAIENFCHIIGLNIKKTPKKKRKKS
eukprot:m.55705 g.55705  ORF g.55705 m.55705 type:complete len:367 (+) comp10999_c0_seq1:114-1214(+)